MERNTTRMRPANSLRIDSGRAAGESPRSDAPPVIVADDVRKEFNGTEVLTGLSLEVAEGKIFGLIGPSGSGKSTTIRLLYGRFAPDAGTVTVLGERPSRFRATTRRRIGFMPRDFVLNPALTVEQNVGFAAGLYGLAEWRHREEIRAVLELVELWDTRGHLGRTLSGGMQRRTTLAAALVHNPDLLLADEPTANIDPILRSRLWQHFHSRAERGQTLLLTTQYIDEAEYCHRVGLLFDGVLIATGRPETLRRQAFGGDIIDVVVENPSPVYARAVAKLPGIRGVAGGSGNRLRVTVVDADQAIPPLVEALEASGARIQSAAPYDPTFDEVFICLIEQHGGTRPSPGRLRTSAQWEE